MRQSMTAGIGAGAIPAIPRIAIARLVSALSRRAIEVRRRRRVRLTCRILEGLDDRTLADIGIPRGEIISTVATRLGEHHR